MTPLLQRAAEAPLVAAADLLDGRPLVVVAPHPDDETLGCGTLLHDAWQAGADCTVVCMTDGAASHPRSRQWPTERLAALRQSELAAAVRVLAPGARSVWLGYPDCGLPDGGAALDRAAGAVAACLPRGALVAAAWEGDPHVDHVRTAQIMRAVAARRPDVASVAYPIWGRFADAPAPRPLAQVAGSVAAAAAKRAALACHRSQMTRLIDDDPDGFVMTAAHQAHFLQTPEIILAA